MSDSRSREMNAARGDHAHDDADAVGCWVTRVPELEHTFSGRLRIDPVDAAAVLARADLGDQYIVYEWAGTWHVAAGAAAELSVTADASRRPATRSPGFSGAAPSAGATGGRPSSWRTAYTVCTGRAMVYAVVAPKSATTRLSTSWFPPLT